MKLISKHYIRISYFLLTALLSSQQFIHAATDDAYTTNDVLLFFQNPAGTTGKDQVVYYSLGSTTTVFREAATPNSSTFGKTIPLGNINAILASTYGADWTGLKATIHAGAVGQNGATSALSSAIANGDYARTVYVTKPRNGAGTVGEANSGSPLYDPATTAVAGQIAGANNITGMAQPGVVAVGGPLSNYNPFTNGNPTTAYGTIAGGIQGPLVTTTSYANLSAVLLLDLYRVTKTTGTNADSATLWHNTNSISPTYSNNSYPASNGARADFLGTIVVGANGDVNFVAKGWVEPVDPPTITSATTASGTVGTSFSYQIVASNGPTEYGATLSQAAGAATANLTINATTGVISGTPVNDGVATIPISATNSNGTGTASLILTISASAGPTPTPTPTPTGPAVTILDISSWTRPSWSRSLYSSSSVASVENGMSSSTKSASKNKAKKSNKKSKSPDKKNKGTRKKKKSR